MPNSSRLGILGLMAIIGSAGVLAGMGDGAPRGGMCDSIEVCPTSQMSDEADLETCTALIPDLRDQVVLTLCNPGTSCYSVDQTPAPGTAVGVGVHEIRLTATVCTDAEARGGNTNGNGNININGNDNTLGNDGCMGAVCFSGGECLVEFEVFPPNLQLQCPESVDPIQLNDECMIVVPDLRNEVTILSCEETSGIEIDQDPSPGTILLDPGFELRIDFYYSEISSCSVYVPILPATACPADFTIFLGSGECVTSMPADLCDGYLLECELMGANSRLEQLPLNYVCHTEPAAGEDLQIGENEVRLIVERCFFPLGDIGIGDETCEVVPELSCTLTITVEAGPPTLNCPTSQPALEPLQISSECTVVVPDLRDADLVTACDGVEYELTQIPEPGAVVAVSNEYELYVEVRLDDGKGFDYCPFYVPLLPYLVCPDSPQTVEYDDECSAVVPDLTDEVEYANCCLLMEEQFRGSRCGEIRITQSPEAGTLLTGETSVVITIERCFFFSQEPTRGIDGEECIEIGTCTVIVRPVDDTPPTIACPDAQTLSADANCAAVVPDLTGGVTVSDNCPSEGGLTVTQDPAAGTSIGVGETIVTLTATDDAGNSASCEVVLTVVDDTPPTFTCPEDFSLGADGDCLGIVPDLTTPEIAAGLMVTDNCSALQDITLTQDPPEGTNLVLGPNNISVTATDAAGNSTTCTVEIFLEENGCLNPGGQPVPGCDPNNQSVNLLFSLLFHSPVCGATCPLTVSMMLCGFLALRRNVRRRRR